MRHIFLTGITGFLGKAVAYRYLTEREGNCIIALVRARNPDHLAQRCERVLADMFGDDADEHRSQIEFVQGDLVSEGLGLSAEDRASIATRAAHFIHCGASVRFDEGLDDARRTNVLGSQQVVELAREAHANGVLERFDYVGTCYVAGDRTDLSLEDELNEGYGFRNSYEQTKWESERHMREVAKELPVTIYRPAIIVGDSETGETSSFNVVYWPIRIFAMGRWNMVIGSAETPIDVVPIDFVSRAMLHISSKPESIGQCYALAAGENCSNVGELTKLAAAFFKRPEPRYIEPSYFYENIVPMLQKDMDSAAGQLIKDGIQYLPYIQQNPLFDNRNTLAALADSDIEILPVRTYFNTLFQYCVDSDWGRKKVKR